ncbi:MAG: peptidoglycan editing factor PgeF [Dethiobacter sp.]|jgi:YfiH family protein|nr:MAG: peptidoglycan editing factor PgeF [Dethiobacter sp.]
MNEALSLTEKDGIYYLFFPRWEKSGMVGHGFSTRLGGISKGPFAYLNLGLKGGDSPENVSKNRKSFLGIWGKQEGDLLYGEQVHGKEVFLVDRDFLDKGSREIPATDALITKERQVLLGAFSADCFLTFFLDPEVPAIGVAHAGWRGTLMGILAGVVEAMNEKFSSKPDALEVLLAPAIGPCCYEVGKEVLELCNASPWSSDTVFYPGIRPGHSFLDLQKTNCNILRKVGIKPANIITNGFCTCCNQDLFYSYRGAKGKATGSHLGIIFLR